MLIRRHSEPHIVELEDGSAWRIWPADLASTLKWMPSTQLTVTEIEDQFCTHALIDQAENTRVRVIAAAEHWPPEAGCGAHRRGRQDWQARSLMQRLRPDHASVMTRHGRAAANTLDAIGLHRAVYPDCRPRSAIRARLAARD